MQYCLRIDEKCKYWKNHLEDECVNCIEYSNVFNIINKAISIFEECKHIDQEIIDKINTLEEMRDDILTMKENYIAKINN